MNSQFSSRQLPTPGRTPSQTDPNAPSSTSYAHHSTTWTPVDSMTPISTNPSRKRSRDEPTFNHDADGSYFPPSATQVFPPEPIPEEPIYGEGMVLLNPRTGMAISPESQTGTWFEEKAEVAARHQLMQFPSQPDFRPRMPSSRKSIRLSQSSIRPNLGDVGNGLPASPPKQTHPEIDEATMALGIGWTQLSLEDSDIQAAARGWAKYLDNHYARHIHGAEIMLKSSGLNAYLIRCQEGFFLFKEDLSEGRLVARTWDACLPKLRCQPMVFDGEEVIGAVRTPGPEAVRTVNGSTHADRDGNAGPVTVEKMENWADYHRLNGMPENGEQELVREANGGDGGGGSGMDLD